MKTGVVALLGLFCTAFGMETVAGRGGIVKSHFEVIKTVNKTMVYHIKRLQDNGTDNACIVASEETARYGISRRYPNGEIGKNGENVYDVKRNELSTTFKVCEEGWRQVYLEHDIISLTPNICQFSAMFCDIQSETVFWSTSTNLEIIARGPADIWILSRQPLVMLLVFKETSGTFILQLLRKIKNDKNKEVWVTNVNGLQAREIPANSTAENVSHLGQYLNHSDFLNINDVNAEDSMTVGSIDKKTDNERGGDGNIKSGGESEGRAFRILSLEQMVLYTFILVVILVAVHFLERIFGLIINCVILSRTRNHGCSALCLNSLSQNMMSNHLHRYYTDEGLMVSNKTSDGVYGVNGYSENKRLSNDISMNVYDKTYSGYFE